MPHFTYLEKIDKGNLQQGDILEKTDGIKKILETYHPHYLTSESYRYFIVLTQSCDVFRRPELTPCKARYITLAAVRPLRLLLSRKAEEYFQHELQTKAGVVDNARRNSFYQFLERLFNNNETEYFYLEEDVFFNFSEPHVAFLRLSISIKTEQHYETCLKAKVLELGDNFKSKLGWTVGNMYSRVGTEDWVPDTLTEEDFKTKIGRTLDANYLWADNVKERLKQLQLSFTAEQVEKMTAEELRKKISDIKIPQKKEKVFDCIKKSLENNELLKTHPEEIGSILRNIQSDTNFAAVFSKK